jgi:hypothetical protein
LRTQWAFRSRPANRLDWWKGGIQERQAQAADEMIIAVKVIARIEKILASLVIDLMQRPVAVHIEQQGKNALIPPAVKPPAKFRQFSLLATRINENLVGIGKNNPVAIAILDLLHNPFLRLG